MAAKKKRSKSVKSARPRKRVKAGGNKTTAAARHLAFIHAYLSNGGNATQAAIFAGYSAKTANVTGSRMLRYAHIKQRLEAERAKAAAASGLSAERTFARAAHLAYFDIRKLFKDGRFLGVNELGPETAAALAGIEVEELFNGKGESRTLAGHLRKIKTVEPVAALRLAAQLQGLLNPDGPPPGAGGTVIIVQAGALDDKI